MGTTRIRNRSKENDVSQTINRTTLEAIPLENIDAIRDSILKIDGNATFDISKTNGGNIPPYTNFAKRKPVNKKLNTTDPQYGLCLKTYNSDPYRDWETRSG